MIKHLTISGILPSVFWDFFVFQENMFLVPFTLSPIPCARRPNFLAKYFNHVFLCLLHLMRCLYSSESPVSLSIMEFPED